MDVRCPQSLTRVHNPHTLDWKRRLAHLREILGYACQQVACTGEPIIVQRYNRQDVVIVPLVDWRFYQEMEAEIRDTHAAEVLVTPRRL
jgi:hypothetical protein